MSADGQAYVRQQLQVWQQYDLDTEAYIQHIPEERVLIYQMLAGQVQQVILSLDLGWRRAMGVFFW